MQKANDQIIQVAEEIISRLPANIQTKYFMLKTIIMKQAIETHQSLPPQDTQQKADLEESLKQSLTELSEQQPPNRVRFAPVADSLLSTVVNEEPVFEEPQIKKKKPQVPKPVQKPQVFQNKNIQTDIIDQKKITFNDLSSEEQREIAQFVIQNNQIKTANKQTNTENAQSNQLPQTTTTQNTKQNNESQTEFEQFQVVQQTQTQIEARSIEMQTEPDENMQINSILHKILKQHTQVVLTPIPNQLIKLTELLTRYKQIQNEFENSKTDKIKQDKEFEESQKYVQELLKQLEEYKFLQNQNQSLEQKLLALQQIVEDLKLKENETQILFTKCQDAYFQSLRALKTQSDQHITKLQEQLAVLFDQLRRMRKIDSFDEEIKSVFDSLLNQDD
ncbi:Conserved_hypothetical protein [Hexamita inflata]|uniref:Uncharacterized protein n=1 Tax=Hexamita inflata TaxID=28002 RepID=A0AA86V1J1_9EUKA|nr:Conserved hypothetical protein [Hexamita inflata]